MSINSQMIMATSILADEVTQKSETTGLENCTITL